jgi:hypothetical protein
MTLDLQHGRGLLLEAAHARRADRARSARSPDRSPLQPLARLVLVLGIAVAASLLGVLAIAQHAQAPGSGPVYSMAEVRTHLAQHPPTWLHRTLSVRAVPEPGLCFAMFSPHGPPCARWRPALADPDPFTLIPPLPLAREAPPAWLDWLRRVPLLGGLALPHRLQWDRPGVYRIQVHTVPCFSTEVPPCFEALMIGAAP